MHPLRFLAIAAAIAPWLAAIAFVVYSPATEDRPADYVSCTKLHPQKYCRLTHLPATVAQEQARGHR
jgi:hypothetical protein